jgi:hypothetical protein
MHFPTSLPRSTGSPAARVRTGDHPPVNVPVHSVHSHPYDGPLPVMPRRPRPLSNGRLRRRPNEKQLSIVTQPTPIYSYLPSQNTQSNAPSDPKAGFTSGSLSEAVPPRVTGPDSTISPPTSGPSNNSMPNVDGIGSVKKLPAKAKSRISGIFGKKAVRLEEDPEESPTDAAEFYEIKRKRWERREAEAKAAASETKSGNSSRARLAIRLLGHRGGKPVDVETGLDLDDEDHHPFDAARKRLHDQRERKMRRKINGSSVVSDSQNEEMPPGESRRHRIVDSMKRGVHFAAVAPKEHLEAYKASREEDSANQEAGMELGSRMGNAVRRMSNQFTSNLEERDAEARRASWASQAYPRRESAPYSTSSSGSPDELLYVPRAADFPDLTIPPVPLFSQRTNAQSPPSPEITPNDQSIDLSMSAYDASQTPARSNSYMFPPKPPAPFFRPTLSPVSSRSPVPTSVAAANSPRKGGPVSASPRMQLPEQDFSASSLHLPLPEVAPPPSASPQKLTGLTIRNAVSPSVSVQEASLLPEGSTALSPIMEQPTPRSSSRKSSHVSKRPSPPMAIAVDSSGSGNTMSSLDISTTAKPPVEPPIKSAAPSVTARSEGKPRASPAITQTLNSPPPFSEIQRPKSPSPYPSPSPLKIGIRTPTQSALDFWKEADESLAPSESASAQIPNRHWEPPPNFWKAADRTLDRSKDKGPSMEEWIASLPGLGLGLGTWGASDGSLDWKYFQAARKLQKRRSTNSVKTLKSKKSAQDMIEENMDALEKVIEDIEGSQKGVGKEEGLTPDEAEALEDISSEPEDQADNSPPTPVDPSLLHPEYKPSLPRPASVAGHGSILETRRPQSRLGKDVAKRLDDMEKYWAEQSLAMGTVLKRMLVVIDNLIIKEREQAQKEARRDEMGWFIEPERVAGEA